MEYRGNHIEDSVYNGMRRRIQSYRHNPAFVDDLTVRAMLAVEKEVKDELEARGLEWRRMGFEIDSAEPYHNDDYPDNDTDGYTDIYLVWEQAETVAERTERIEREKSRIDNMISEIFTRVRETKESVERMVPAGKDGREMAAMKEAVDLLEKNTREYFDGLVFDREKFMRDLNETYGR